MFLLEAIFIVGSIREVVSNCGRPPITPSVDKIVGGQVAVAYSWPWQVDFCARNGWPGCSLMCGGTVISPNWIMTAGHCVFHNQHKPGSFKIMAGIFGKDAKTEAGAEVLDLEEIFLHPLYDNHLTSHDIALLKLSAPLNFTDHIQPVCLPKSDDLLAIGTLGTVTGWGTTQTGGWGPTAKQLMQVQIPIASESVCKANYAKKGDEVIEDFMFCAGAGGKDSCQGDSGGPLVLKHQDDDRWYQHGIVSWGYSCAIPGFPGVYSRVSAYCDFIANTTNSEITCM